MSRSHFHSVLVTGANRGIGLELVKQLLELPEPPKWVFATCRDPQGGRIQELRSLASKHPNLVILQLEEAKCFFYDYSCSAQKALCLVPCSFTFRSEGSWISVSGLSDWGGDTPSESTDEASIKAAAKQAEVHLAGSGLNLLINNAGVMPPSTLESVTKEDMLSVYNINLVGPMLVTKAFLPMLKVAAKRSSKTGLSCSRAAIINVSTIGSSITTPPPMRMFPVISYRCSKTALNMLTRCQALEYKDDGIMSVALHPGWVKTEMGTDKAELTVQESVRGIIQLLSSLGEEKNSLLVNWEGKIVPW